MSGGWGSFFRWISRTALSTAATPDRLSAPRAVFGFPETRESPRCIGLQPTHKGTVSRCAMSILRGARIVPGSFTMRLPVLPPAGDFLCALSVVIADAGIPAAVNRRHTCFVICSSWQLGPGTFIRSTTRSMARFASTVDGSVVLYFFLRPCFFMACSS